MSVAMNEKLLELQQKVDALSQRERILVFLMAAAAVVMLIQLVLIDPVASQRSLLKTQIQQTSSQLQQLESERQVIDAQLTVGVNRSKTQKRDQLRQQLEQLDRRIEQSVVAMIPPRLMTEVLEKVLIQNGKLKLVGVENKPVKSIVEQSPAQDDGQGLFKHAFVLTLEGGYMSAINYFEKLAELPWRFYWDNLHYEVSQYPKATIRLEVHTVSMSEEWIGV